MSMGAKRGRVRRAGWGTWLTLALLGASQLAAQTDRPAGTTAQPSVTPRPPLPSSSPDASPRGGGGGQGDPRMVIPIDGGNPSGVDAVGRSPSPSVGNDQSPGGSPRGGGGGGASARPGGYMEGPFIRVLPGGDDADLSPGSPGPSR